MPEIIKAIGYGFAFSIPISLIGIFWVVRRERKRIIKMIQEKKNAIQKKGENADISRPAKKGWWRRKFGRKDKTGDNRGAVKDSSTDRAVPEQRIVQDKPAGSESKAEQYFH